jgi:hypothetical protein
MIPFPSKSANFSPVRIFSRARRHRDRAVSPFSSIIQIRYEIVHQTRNGGARIETEHIHLHTVRVLCLHQTIYVVPTGHIGTRYPAPRTSPRERSHTTSTRARESPPLASDHRSTGGAPLRVRVRSIDRGSSSAACNIILNLATHDALLRRGVHHARVGRGAPRRHSLCHRPQHAICHHQDQHTICHHEQAISHLPTSASHLPSPGITTHAPPAPFRRLSRRTIISERCRERRDHFLS